MKNVLSQDQSALDQQTMKLVSEARNLVIYLTNYQFEVQRAANSARRAQNKQMSEKLQAKVARLSRLGARASSRYSRRVSNRNN
jgi:hypothetical protein